MRVVLDTNVLLQAVTAHNPLRPLFDAFVLEQFDLIVTTEILLEYQELFGRKHKVEIAAELYALVTEAPNLILQETYYKWRLPFADPDDQKFVDCYVASNADYLVSNDRHFGGLSAAGFPAVRVVSAEVFYNHMI
ncbi:putative toxin-antitoxin system toxin component, PIN family [uncultured Hymenobacter sp.]|uniref:putative toxin-antitoxin system toxin component, PIN family n=1 Tax=uncultured Hymenobacter sp. TaxID=170016 RepID=UPI0035CC6B15